MKSEISKVVIKNVKIKVSKFSLQIYAFLYSKRMDFLHSDFESDVLTKCFFFPNIYKLQKVKIHLDHSHVTGNICG